MVSLATTFAIKVAHPLQCIGKLSENEVWSGDCGDLCDGGDKVGVCSSGCVRSMGDGALQVSPLSSDQFPAGLVSHSIASQQFCGHHSQ